MSSSVLLPVLAVLALLGYCMGRRRAGGDARALHSRPVYHGTYLALWCAVPAAVAAALWLALQPFILEGMIVSALPADLRDLPPDRLGLLVSDITSLADGNIVGREPNPATEAAARHLNELRTIGNGALLALVCALGIGAGAFALRNMTPQLRARNHVETATRVFLIGCSMIAIVTTVGIVLSLIFESIRFFGEVPVTEFLFGTEWSPQTALRKDQVGASGAFGAIPLFAGTLLITGIAMLIAVPIGLFSAIYLADYASRRMRGIVKPILEILAGIPTVVYGFFAALTVAPHLRGMGSRLGLDVASESALAAGLVMGIMIIPFISSLSDDVINAVPRSLRDGSYALGATQSETIKRVILPAALPGIFAAFLLAVSRAIGETMIVVMAAGLAANLTANPFEAVTTVTVQIVTLLIGDQEFDSAKTLAAFALGLVLFCATLTMNVIALMVVRKYREQYD